MKTITTSSSTVQIPDDWHQVETEPEKSLKFANFDGMQVAFIGDWRVNAYENPTQFLRGHQDREIDRLALIDGNDFKVLEDRVEQIGAKTVGILDVFDEEHHFRMYSKTILFQDQLLRCSFHDYWSKTIDESNQVALAIVKSFDMGSPK